MKKFKHLVFCLFGLVLPHFLAAQTETETSNPLLFNPKTAVVARLVDGKMATSIADSILIKSMLKGMPNRLSRVDKIRFAKSGSHTWMIFRGWNRLDPPRNMNVAVRLRPDESDGFFFDAMTQFCESNCDGGSCGDGNMACGSCNPGEPCRTGTAAVVILEPLEKD